MSNKKPFVVEDRYRKNSLSLEEGGVDIIVTFEDGTRRKYTRIKNPINYIPFIETTSKVVGYETIDPNEKPKPLYTEAQMRRAYRFAMHFKSHKVEYGKYKKKQGWL